MNNQGNINVIVKGIEEVDAAVKKFNDSVEAMKLAAFELSRLGVHVEINVNDLWKSR